MEWSAAAPARSQQWSPPAASCSNSISVSHTKSHLQLLPADLSLRGNVGGKIRGSHISALGS